MGTLPEGLPDQNAPSTENKAQPPPEKVYANEAPERESGMEYTIISCYILPPRSDSVLISITFKGLHLSHPITAAPMSTRALVPVPFLL